MTFRYIDDVLYLKKSTISEFIDLIYPYELEMTDMTESGTSASYLDCYLYIDNGKLVTRLYDKRDYFKFFNIVKFPFLSSNIPLAPTYGVYVFQPVRYRLEPVANIKALLIKQNCSSVNCCHKAIVEQSFCQL